MSDQESTTKKQSVTGFKVVSYNSKKTKENVKFRIVLEADVDEIGIGPYSFGDAQGSLLSHLDSEVPVGLSLFIDKK